MAVELDSWARALALVGLPIALIIALAHIMFRPRRNGRRTRFRTVLRIFLPTRVWLHSSTLLDFQYLIIGKLTFSAVWGFTLLSMVGVGNTTRDGLARLFGPQVTSADVPIFVQGFIVFGLYMAHEFAYWLDHFLSHKIPFLWEFHKVHHSATVLTPFANWRTHPVDSIVYWNIQTLIVGGTIGLIQYCAGESISLTSTAIFRILFSLYLALWGHLQHSQFWISSTGLAGRIFMSPAHHQIHHSNNPIHFDRNFGAALAVWDWLFCTLHIPQRKNEHLHFGADGDAHLKSLVPSMVYPFHYACKRLLSRLPRKQKGQQQQSRSDLPTFSGHVEVTPLKH